MRQAPFTEIDVLHRRNVGETGKNHLRVGQHIPRAGGWQGPHAGQLLHDTAAPVVDRELESRPEQVLGHGLAHPAQADETDLHDAPRCSDSSPSLHDGQPSLS